MPIRIAPISPLNLAAAAALVGSAASAAHAQPPVASYTIIDDGADGTFERLGSGNCVGSSPTQRTVLRAEFAVAPLEGMLIYNPLLFVGFEGAPGTDPQQEYAVSWYIADGVASLEDADAVRTPLEMIDISSGFYPHIIGLMVDTVEPCAAAFVAGSPYVGFEVRETTTHGVCLPQQVPSRIGYDCPSRRDDYNSSGGVDGDDITAFLSDWLLGAPCADVDYSGGLDHDDIVAFFDCWQAC